MGDETNGFVGRKLMGGIAGADWLKPKRFGQGFAGESSLGKVGLDRRTGGGDDVTLTDFAERDGEGMLGCYEGW